MITSEQMTPDGAQGAEHRRLEAGQTLYFQGEQSHGLYLVRTGMVKLVRYLPNGRARIVGLHGAGAVIGLPPDAGGQLATHPHSAIAANTVQCDLLPSSVLKRIRREDGQRYLALLETVYGQREQADFWLCELSTGPIRSRVARLIRFLETLDPSLPAGELELLTCQEMGEMLGVTPESVSRTVAEMKRERLLSPADGGSATRFRCDDAQLERLAVC